MTDQEREFEREAFRKFMRDQRQFILEFSSHAPPSAVTEAVAWKAWLKSKEAHAKH